VWSGIDASVEWSPSPTSSANADLMKLVRNSGVI
jgi:hypothetical protein